MGELFMDENNLNSSNKKIDLNKNTNNSDVIEAAQEKNNTSLGKHAKNALKVSFAGWGAILLAGITKVGWGEIWPLFLTIAVATCIFLGTNITIVKGFFGLGAIGGIFYMGELMAGKYALLLFGGYFLVAIIACIIANKRDECEEQMNGDSC